MESNTLLATVIFLVVSVGVGGLTVVFLNKLYKLKQFDGWTDGWKRFFAVALAIAVITILWGFGLFMRYFEMPSPDARAWVEAWFSVIFPAPTVQQLIQGFTKPDQGQS